MTQQYNKISKWIDQCYRLHTSSPTFHELTNLVTDRITWAYKYKKITEAEKDELCSRMIRLFKLGEEDYDE